MFSLLPIQATVYNYVGPTNGGNVNVSANFQLSAGTLTLTVSNNTPNIVTIGQGITDMFFNLSGVNTATLTSITGTQVQVNGDGSTSPSNISTVGTWTLSGGPAFHLDDLNGGQPDLAIIGPPTGGVYSSANGSIASNGPHNPFFNTTAVFTITNAAITQNTVISGVQFSFGTTAGDNRTAILSSVPEPISLTLVGGGLMILGLVRRRLVTR